MAKKSLRPKQEEAAIDMTPMLDIVFIMLIFFIVTASFVKESGAKVNKPEAINSSSRPLANIFIAVTEFGDVYMLKKRQEKSAVRGILEKLLIENPNSRVVIQADKNADSGIVLDVIDDAKRAGIQQVSVAAEK